MIYAIIWLVVFASSFTEYGALTAAIGATLITAVVGAVYEKKWRP